MSSSAIQSSTSAGPNSGLRYARYVGRVGALAVSMGVGFAVVMTPGVAYAEETAEASGPTNNPTSNDGSPTTDVTSSSTVANGTATDTRQNRRFERNRLPRVLGLNPGSLTRRALGVRSSASGRADDQTNGDVQNPSDTSGDDPVSGDNAVVIEHEADGDGGATGPVTTAPVTTPRVTNERKSVNDAVRQLVSPRRVPVERSVRQAVPQAATSTAAATAPVNANKVDQTVAAVNRSVQASVTAITTTVSQLSSGVAQRAVIQPTLTVAPVTPAVRTPVVRPAALVSGFLAAVGLVPTLTPPSTPAPAPTTFVWAVLAFVRREIEQVQRTFLNRTPDAGDDAVNTFEQTSITFDPRGNDRDDDTLTITGLNTTGTHGTVTTDGKTITYTPNADTAELGPGETVTDTFTYTVSDVNSPAHLHGFFGLFGRGHSDTATVTVTIRGNEAPVVVDDAYRITGPTTVTSVLANDSDADGDPLRATLVSGNDPNKGTLTFNPDGTFTYTPKDNFTGTDSFTYEASDGIQTTTGTVTLNVNTAPVVNASAQLVDPATGRVVVRLYVRDSANDNLRVTRSAASPNFTNVEGESFSTPGDDFVEYGESIVYEPTPEARVAAANGGPTEETWTFTVSDGVSTITRTVTVPITPATTTVADIQVGEPNEADGAVTLGVSYGYTELDGVPAPAVGATTGGHGDVRLSAATIDSDGTTVRVNIQYIYTPDEDARTAAYNGTGPTSDTVTITVGDQEYTVEVPIHPAAAVVTGVITASDGGLVNPVDVGVTTGGDRGIVIGSDGAATIIERDGDGWKVGAGVDASFGDSRGGVAVDVDRAYIGGEDDSGGGRLTVVDLDSGRATEISGLSDRGVGRVTDVKLDRTASGRVDSVWAVDVSGRLLEVDAASGTVRRTIETRELQARGVAVDESARSVLAVAPQSSRVYVATGNRITLVKTRELETALARSESDGGLSIDRAVDVDGEVTALEVSADGRRLYATVVGTASGRAELVEYDARTLERVRGVEVGADARALALSDDGNRAYVTKGRDVAVVELRELAVVRSIDTGSATGVAFVPGRDTILVTNPTTNAVAVVSNPYRAATVANADVASTGEDNSVVINVLANDTDSGGATLTPTVVSGPAHGTVTLNEDGTFRYTPNANYYGTDTFSYTVTGGTSNAAPTNVNVTVNKAINVSLSWGSGSSAPRDLDAHLIGPAASGGESFHVFYSNRTYEVTTQGLAEVGAFLDVDDVDGAGPEVIEINTRTPGEYLYYVDNFSNDGRLGTSAATVTVVDSASGLSRTFTVSSGSGRYWSVFTMTVSADGAVTITALDHLSDTAPTLEDPTPETAISA